MNDEFKPPISERTTTELLEIVGDYKKWNTRAVQLANNELQNRKVEQKKIETAKYLSKKKKRVEKNLKANESYHICDFIFEPFGTLFEIIVSWELRKDGYVRKAEQQKILRLIIGIIVLIFFIIFKLQNY